MPNALFKRFNGTSWEEFKFSAYDSEKLGGVLPSGYALASHPHAISDVLTLQTTLDGKLSSSAGSVTNTNLANMLGGTVKGRALGSGTGAPVDLTSTQLTAIINEATENVPGTVLLSQSTTLDADENAVITENVLRNYMGTAGDKIAFGNHSHHNLLSTGAWASSPATIESGDRLVIVDASATPGRINHASLTFGTATDTFLANNGTWQPAGGGGGGAQTFGFTTTEVLTTIGLDTYVPRLIGSVTLEPGTYTWESVGSVGQIGTLAKTYQVSWTFNTVEASDQFFGYILHAYNQNVEQAPTFLGSPLHSTFGLPSDTIFGGFTYIQGPPGSTVQRGNMPFHIAGAFKIDTTRTFRVHLTMDRNAASTSTNYVRISRGFSLKLTKLS